MDDSVWIMIGLCVVGGIVLGTVKGLWVGGSELKNAYVASNAQRQYRADQIRTLTERRALQMLAEFPNLSDHEIAVLMHDELMNNRTGEQEWFRWATAETVGRMRRTILVEIARQSRQ